MKTAGFLTVLQPIEEPKLTMPCSCQTPFSAWQFSGPPESPCNRWQCEPGPPLEWQGQRAGAGLSASGPLFWSLPGYGRENAAWGRSAFWETLDVR